MAATTKVHSQQDATIKNWTLWSMLIATERIVGQENLATVLRHANLPQYIGNFPLATQEYGNCKQSHIARLEQSITETYGTRGANAILLGIGREYAQNTIQEFLSGIANIFVTANSFLPKNASVRNAVEQTVKGMNGEFEAQAQVVEQEGELYIDDPACVHCMGRHADSAICVSQRGFLKAMVEHSKPGSEIQVDEILCKAKGDLTCRFRISLAGSPSQPSPKQPDIPRSI